MIYNVFVSTEAVVTIEAPDEQSAIDFAWKCVGGEAFCNDPEITGVDMLGVSERQDIPPDYVAAPQEAVEAQTQTGNKPSMQVSSLLSLFARNGKVK